MHSHSRHLCVCDARQQKANDEKRRKRARSPYQPVENNTEAASGIVMIIRSVSVRKRSTKHSRLVKVEKVFSLENGDQFRGRSGEASRRGEPATINRRKHQMISLSPAGSGSSSERTRRLRRHRNVRHGDVSSRFNVLEDSRRRN